MISLTFSVGTTFISFLAFLHVVFVQMVHDIM